MIVRIAQAKQFVLAEVYSLPECILHCDAWLYQIFYTLDKLSVAFENVYVVSNSCDFPTFRTECNDLDDFFGHILSSVGIEIKQRSL